VAVIGAGYVGLPLCLHLAKAGLKVIAVDVNPRVVDDIQNRTAKIEEKEDFEHFFNDPDVQVNLTAQTVPTKADAFVIAVPTPIHEDKRPDLRAVEAAVESILPFVGPGNLVVVESTIPPFTTERLIRPLLEKSGYRVGHELLLAHCPERILPGNIMVEAVFNARIIGGVDQRSAERAGELYGSFVKGKLWCTNARTAEFVKLIENSYRDVNVAFANQVAILCEELGIDTHEAIELANQHPRVDILNPGIGVGGHCIPIDPWFLVDTLPDAASLIKAARVLNDGMPERTAAKILRSVEGVSNPRIVCLGATYKPNVKDKRESPALEVFALLKGSGADVSLYDPLLPECSCDSVLTVARGADALAVLVPHDLIVTEITYRKREILAAMRKPNILVFTPGILRSRKQSFDAKVGQ
jgi:UDP-N-acetyl-D-mannosaminuronic acid dehydrogenase